MSDPHPRRLEGSDLVEAVRYVFGNVKAPAVGQLLQAAGCADPEPSAGKRKRIRSAIEATQQRDGHGGAVVKLMESVAAAEASERRRSEVLRDAYQSSGVGVPRATVRAEDGFRLRLGVTGTAPDLAITLTVLPDLEGTPILLRLDQARDLYRELGEVGREVRQRVDQVKQRSSNSGNQREPQETDQGEDRL